MATTLTLIPALLSGTAFGAALTTSSVYLPSVILSQLSLQSTLMLRTFLTASACSAAIVYVARRLQFAALPARKNSSRGWFGAYDANLVGGLMQGVGMALTGACPGTVLVQVALGVGPAAAWVLVGGLLGGAVFVLVDPSLERVKLAKGKGEASANVNVNGNGNGNGKTNGAEQQQQQQQYTVMQKLGISEETAVFWYEVLLIAVIAVADKVITSRGHKRYLVNPVVGGLLIGVAQATSVVLSKKTLGVSSAYSEVAGHLTGLFSGKGLGGGWSNTVFAAGVMVGAKLISQRLPVIIENGPAIGISTAIAGGAFSIFGARLAGGCTSGHGISGMSTLGLSSFVTVAGMFGGGIAFRLVLNALA